MKTAYQIIIVQLCIAILATSVCWIVAGHHAAASAAAAALVATLPNLLFALRMFAHSGARAARHILKSFYRGEMLKFIATMALFLVSIKYLQVMFLPFFITFCLCQAAFWFAPWLGSTNRTISA